MKSLTRADLDSIIAMHGRTRDRDACVMCREVYPCRTIQLVMAFCTLFNGIRDHRDSPTVPHTAEWDDALEDLYALAEQTYDAS